MIDHIELHVRDIDRSTAFYRVALAPIGYSLHVQGPSFGFGTAPDRLDFWLRNNGAASSPTPHFAFGCATRDAVVRAHEAAVRAGGVDCGAAAVLAHIHPSYFAAFVRDPDGHNVEFVCHAAAAVAAPCTPVAGGGSL